ncbi:MAG: hypothetical protein D8B59_10975 [Bacteroidetes bacterium]|nr:MAG: hypothetical protein D8B59_10975 [Bacteroidota bacterium]
MISITGVTRFASGINLKLTNGVIIVAFKISGSLDEIEGSFIINAPGTKLNPAPKNILGEI